jgi:sialate O-acetylesterase
MRISFEYADEGLMLAAKEGLHAPQPIPDGKLQWITIAGEDRIFHPAEAQIDGAELIVWSDDVPSPTAARYAFTQDPVGANLYNRAGLPASPFRTDSW